MKNIEIVKKIMDSRPSSNHNIDQVLMTIPSIFYQLDVCSATLKNKRVIFIGDDDHMSLVFNLFFNTKCYVFEYDKRIIQNIKYWNDVLQTNVKVFEYSAKDELKVDEKYDFFYINPPYGSHNNAFGVKVWLSRVLPNLLPGSEGILIYPIIEKYSWSIANIQNIEKFILENESLIVRIDKNVHNYLDASHNDIASSNIWIKYLGGAKNLLGNIDDNDKLYR